MSTQDAVAVKASHENGNEKEEYYPREEKDSQCQSSIVVSDKVEIVFERGVEKPFGMQVKDSYGSFTSNDGSFSTSSNNSPNCTMRKCCMTNYWMAIFCILSMEREWSSERNIFECSVRM